MNIECNYTIPHHDSGKCELEFSSADAGEPSVRISVSGCGKICLTLAELEEIVRLSQIFDHAAQMMTDAKNNAIVRE